MKTLVCLGFGYSAESYVSAFGQRFERIIGTVRTVDKAKALAVARFGGHRIEPLVFDGSPGPLAAAFRDADAVLMSIPPGEGGDPALTHCSDALTRANRLSSIVYLSTIGVYGDHSGAWIDEAAPLQSLMPRSRERILAEQGWQAIEERIGAPVALLRLAGIYGPGQNALVQLARGAARRIVKPGQVFNRIHVEDIAQAIEASFAQRAAGPINVCDDEPAPATDVIAYAAGLLGIAPPPEALYAEAEKGMSEMAKSFYAECKRARNEKLKSKLGVRLRYPTYREGLRALFEAGDHAR